MGELIFRYTWPAGAKAEYSLALLLDIDVLVGRTQHVRDGESECVLVGLTTHTAPVRSTEQRFALIEFLARITLNNDTRHYSKKKRVGGAFNGYVL
jgi:hypothetical protein